MKGWILIGEHRAAADTAGLDPKKGQGRHDAVPTAALYHAGDWIIWTGGRTGIVLACVEIAAPGIADTEAETQIEWPAREGVLDG